MEENKNKAPEQQDTKRKKAKKAGGNTTSLIICAVIFAAMLLLGGMIGDGINLLTSKLGFAEVDAAPLPRLILMISGLFLLFYIFRAVFSKWQPKNSGGKTFSSLMDSLLHYVLALTGIFWGLSILGVDVNTLLAGAGVVTLVIGFGAESLIADVITGIFMLFERQYEVGDVILVGDFRGTVTKIGIRTTSVADSGGNVKIINNSDLRNLVNRSSESSVAVCDLGVTYDGKAVRSAEAILAKELPKLYGAHPSLFLSAPEYVGVQQLSLPDNAAILRVVAKVNEVDIFKAQRLMNRELFLALEDAGISNPSLEISVESRN